MSYSITPHSDGSSFNVEVVSTNGARQTMLGFATEAEAQTWVDRDVVRDADVTRSAE